MKQATRPETDVRILEGLGFGTVQSVNIPRWRVFLRYLKHGHHAGMEFLIEASV